MGIDQTVLGRVGCGVGRVSSPRCRPAPPGVSGVTDLQRLCLREVLEGAGNGSTCSLRWCHPRCGDILLTWRHELHFLDFLETEPLVKEQAHRGIRCTLPRGQCCVPCLQKPLHGPFRKGEFIL